MKLLELLARVASRFLPERVFWRIHGLVAAILTPMSFSYGSGHLRSSIIHRPMDRHGNPLPWMTYPSIAFLEAKDFTNRAVLEWGSGYSTLWWAGKASSVVSFESDRRWFDLMSKKAPTNVSLHLVDDDLKTLPESIEQRKFDVIVVDGLNRAACAEKSVQLLAVGGALILDDSQQPWSKNGSKQYVIIDLLRNRGFQRVDFYGYAPAVIRRHCTSLFFKDDCFLLSGDKPPGD